MAVESSVNTATPVFVYGTLRSGGSHHHLLAGQDFIGPARSLSRFLLAHWRSAQEPVGYPAAIESDAPPAAALEGEIYAVDAPTLGRLDAYEDHPALYDRRPYEFVLADQRRINAMLYCAPRAE